MHYRNQLPKYLNYAISDRMPEKKKLSHQRWPLSYITANKSSDEKKKSNTNK